MMSTCLLSLLLLGAQPAADASDLVAEISRLRGQVAFLETQLAKRDEALEGMRRDIRTLGDDVGSLRERMAPAPLAGPFLAAPPASSDAVGVARVAVFDPRVEVDATRRHDAVSFRVRRIEAGAVKPVGDVDLGSDQDGVDLPLDQNGALYVVDWSTSEGSTFALVLKDGASRLPVATVQVKQYQKEGRFILVGYRLE
jgi:hypothetical protein